MQICLMPNNIQTNLKWLRRTLRSDLLKTLRHRIHYNQSLLSKTKGKNKNLHMIWILDKHKTNKGENCHFTLQSRRNACSLWSVIFLLLFPPLILSKKFAMQFCPWDAILITLCLPAVFAQMKLIITAEASVVDCQSSGVDASLWVASVAYLLLVKLDLMHIAIMFPKMDIFLSCSHLM